MKNFSRADIFTMVIIFLLGLTLRFYNLSNIPPGIHGDEAEFGLRQQLVIAEKNTSLFTLYDPHSLFNYSVLSYWTQGIFQLIFGETVFGIRASSALAGSMSIIIFFFMTQLFFKQKIISILLMLGFATSHWHIAYSRLAINNSWTPFFIIASLGFLYKAFKTNKQTFYLASGIMWGLSLYFAQANRVIPIIAILWCLIHICFKKGGRLSNLKSMTSMAVAGLLTFLPLGIFYLNTPGVFSSRTDIVSIFNHLPEYYVRYQTENIFGVLFWQFINTLKVFPIGGDIGFYFYAYPGGLLAPVSAILAIAGLAIVLRFTKTERSLLFLSWFLSIIILGGVITIDAPSSQRLLAVIPALYLFIGVALEKLLQLKLTSIKLILVILFAINSLWDYKIYFRDYINTQAGWAQREPATQIAYYLKSLGNNWKVYMLREEPWFYFQHGTIKFINPDLEGYDIENLQTAVLLEGLSNKNVVYIMPYYSPSLTKLLAFYPTGNVQLFLNPIGNTPAFASFEIKNQSLLRRTIEP